MVFLKLEQLCFCGTQAFLLHYLFLRTWRNVLWPQTGHQWLTGVSPSKSSLVNWWVYGAYLKGALGQRLLTGVWATPHCYITESPISSQHGWWPPGSCMGAAPFSDPLYTPAPPKTTAGGLHAAGSGAQHGERHWSWRWGSNDPPFPPLPSMTEWQQDRVKVSCG